ncbi:Sec-independent protein translocase protein TatA [Maioricimonas rarisocia]|uniref:Sec-independent protein translocase protein TatA n=1 Tax=Maioricimonas rarisocia TaxID=2528026 RepID=A0A517ZC39_9PLAN|nr:twin-arginine translocase TatA/TatE family subunit [Maioricimonas rarisocia]QDU40022.1 Sec-independent protein translocase protein TatA [Maioricimonas rarisocia]
MPFGGVGPYELLVVGVIALLLFGKRLPEVARSLGKGIVEFKKGMSGIEDEIKGASTSSYSPPPQQRRPEPRSSRESELTAPKFEPPRSEPVATSTSSETTSSN